MMQIKKKILLLLLAFVLLPSKAYAKGVIDSDVADQKSVIEEQQELPVRTRDEELIKSPYLGMIEELTDEEKDMICRVTWLESGNQPIEGQRAVIEVILNRVNLEIWPDTVEKVLSAPRQFSTWRVRNKVTQEQIDQMMEVLEEVKIKETVLTNDYVYFNNSPHPSDSTVKIEGHWFWK